MEELKSNIVSAVSNASERIASLDLVRGLSESMRVDEAKVKRAMNELVFDGDLEYTYYGGKTYLEVPLARVEREGSHRGPKRHPES